MAIKNNFAMVMPYYGKLPWYFNYFLRSLEGKALDVLLITNLQIDEHPKNLKIVRMSEQGVLKLVENKLGRRIQYNGPYKFCDFKPMYGIVFEEYLRGYSFWGYGDCDLIFGEAINDFIKERVIEGRDIVSVRKWWMTGPFCMMKNTPKVNELFLKARSLEDVFSTAKCVGFDELGGMWYYQLMDGSMSMEECERKKDYFTETVWRQKDIDFYHEEIMNEGDLKHEYVQMKDGHVFINGTEWPIYHMINMKRCPMVLCRSVDYEKIGDYYICRLGVVHSEFIWKIRWLMGCYRFIFSKVVAAKWYYRKNGIVLTIVRLFEKVRANGR